MITTPTCFVLGAGASVPYQFPTGRKLKDRILSKLRQTGPHSSDLRKLLRSLKHEDECIEAFRLALGHCGMASVDAFLEDRREFLELGKDAIAESLMRHESIDLLMSEDSAGGPWYHYLFREMTEGASGGSFCENEVSIVTLNYDRSLDYYLWKALQAKYGMDERKAAKTVDFSSIEHVYGQLGRPHFLDAETGRDYNSTDHSKPALVRQCASNIVIMTNARAPTKAMARARVKIANTKVLCLLGFGYHNANIVRLGLNEPHAWHRALGSCYGEWDDERRRHRERLNAPVTLGSQHLNSLEFLKSYPVFD